MRDYKKDLAHQPKVLPENGGFQQPINTVPEYQYSHSSKIPNSLIEESSTVEGYPPNQLDSYHQPHPQPHESAAPLPPRSSSSYQYNAPPPQSSAPLSSIHGSTQFAVLPPESNLSTERDQSSNNNQGGQPSAPGGTPSMQGHARHVEANAQARTKASEGHTTHHYNEQQLPVSANYQPSAHCTDHWDDEDESNTPVAYPVQYYQHGHAPVASIPVDPHVTTTPTGHPIHTSPINHEHVNPVPNVYGAPHKLPSQQPMVQQQPSLPPGKPLQQPSIVSTLSDAKPPDGYPTAGPNRPSPEPQSSGCRCRCTIL